MTPANLSGLYSYCNTTLDLIGTCWPRSEAGALVERPCPEYFNGVKYNTTRNAYRECLENGTWASRINYSQCEPILDDKRKYDLQYRVALVINYLGHCVSLAALVAAFLLFLALRSVHCLRNVIHWNLITTFILRNVTWFLLQLIDHDVHESNEVWCRCITTIFNYFVTTNFFWMFVEGCYLHTAIVLTYSTEHLRKWLFLFVGWCIPCPVIIVWALGKLYYENEQCWFGKEPGDLVDYIYQGPIILVLLINFVFLFNIVRILMTKLRASTTSETMQYRASLCPSSTASSTVRCGRPFGKSGTAGKTTTHCASQWPGPCPSPRRPQGSAFTASSRRPPCDPPEPPSCHSHPSPRAGLPHGASPPRGFPTHPTYFWFLLCRSWRGGRREGTCMLHPAGERQCLGLRGHPGALQEVSRPKGARSGEESPWGLGAGCVCVCQICPLDPHRSPTTEEKTEAWEGQGAQLVSVSPGCSAPSGNWVGVWPFSLAQGRPLQLRAPSQAACSPLPCHPLAPRLAGAWLLPTGRCLFSPVHRLEGLGRRRRGRCGLGRPHSGQPETWIRTTQGFEEWGWGVELEL
ncbi:corticotropin-releasing factor receptor 2 isoform X2 [Echinops telfairi]|uniref:Corticotropin-releasing factor receptor 2 isoform X2 n=1 Tax=Echinops telfairi TaxID=9371 RepID=A0AC55CZH0_ECHTE|nr:corticotropin-releasing factor receptor 2 isoform X2 [Echinops telfairi]